MNLQKNISKQVELYFLDNSLESTELLLNGTGVNGGIQYTILNAVGYDRLSKLKAVNLISGSTYSYLCFIAFNQNNMKMDLNNMAEWDRLNRGWHNASFIRGLQNLFKLISSSTPIYENSKLAEILIETAGKDFSSKSIDNLPDNFRIWTFNASTNKLEIIDKNSGDLKIRDLVRFSSSVPKLYGTFNFENNEYIDPVYSGKIKELLGKIRGDAPKLIYSSNSETKTKGTRLQIKPHNFKNYNRTIQLDFLKMILNLPNSNILEAHSNAYHQKK